jgi:DNA-directed RNA polymerase I subunit RPA49
MEESANATRLIPAYDADAQRPEDIYPLHNIISETEWAAIDTLLPQLKNAADDHARVRLLPNTRSDWFRQHLMLAYSSSKPKAKIVCVPFLHRIPSSRFTKSCLKQKNIDLRLGDVRIPRCSGETCPRKDLTVGASGSSSGSCGRRPSCPIYGDAQRIYCVSWSLFLRYHGSCEDSRARITSDNETSLLTHLFSLCLKVDDYATDTGLLAVDLKMAPTRCDTFNRLS